jgi:hypothetical protein
MLFMCVCHILIGSVACQIMKLESWQLWCVHVPWVYTILLLQPLEELPDTQTLIMGHLTNHGPPSVLLEMGGVIS